MVISTIDSFYDFLKLYTENTGNLIFRGVRNSEHKLIPSVGRIKRKDGNALDVDDEKLLLNIFRNKGYPFY